MKVNELVKELRKNLNKKHGLSNTRIFNIWNNMQQRCYNPNNPRFSYYGARGITICDEWKNDFKSFYDWSMENGYQDNLTIDRIDVNGDYEPSNCRWCTMEQQSNNRRNNHYITYNNKKQTLTEWCNELNIKPDFIQRRIKKGVTEVEIFNEVIERRHAMRDGRINQQRGKTWEDEIMDCYYNKGWQPFKISTEISGTVFDIILIKNSSCMCIEAKCIKGDKLYFKSSGLSKKQDELNHFVSHCKTNVYIFVKSDKTGCFWTSWIEAKNHFLKKGYICKEDCIDMGGMLE